MAMTASSRAPQGAGSPQSERSPFARLTELLAPYQPAKPLITLSLGEPQHPVPDFVGPLLALGARIAVERGAARVEFLDLTGPGTDLHDAVLGAGARPWSRVVTRPA